MILVLGLDIATTTGFAVLNEKTVIKCGSFKLEDLDHRSRFKYFRRNILKLVKEYKPNLVVIEETYVGPNVKITAYLNMLKGICIECIPSKVKVKSEVVSKIRKEILGSGKKHTKQDVFRYVVNKFNIENLNIKKDLDVSDAILLSVWGLKELTDGSN